MSTIQDFTVPWTILREPPPTIRGGPDGQSGEVHFHVALNDLTPFVATLAGTTETINLEGGGTIERIVPLKHPDKADLLAMGYEATAMGTPGGVGGGGLSTWTAMFSHYRVRVDFATLPLGTGGDTAYYTITTDTGESYETLPDAALVHPDGEPVSGDVGLSVPVTVLNLTTFLSVTPVTFALASLTGKVNSAIMDGFPIGTLRFTGPRSEYSQGLLSRSLVKSYGLRFREVPWNQVLKRNGTWSTPTFSGSGLTRFGTADLNQLKYL